MTKSLSLARALPEYHFELDPRVSEPASFHVVFVILLDGDLVMSPEHLGVALMAAVLRRAGFRASIVEVEHDAHQEGIDAIHDMHPSLVCFTLMSLNVASWLGFSTELRARLPGVPIASGGPAGTYSGAELLEVNPVVDIVAVGEGEPTIFELVQRLYLGHPLDDCMGVYFRKSDGSVQQNPVRPLMHNLDALPFAARDQLEQHGNELEYVRISTSRGCVARCAFCSAPHAGNRVQSGKAWRGRSVESVLDELQHLVETYRFRTYDFIDSTFEDPDGGKIGKARIAAIAQGIIDRKLDIYYNCCMRAENWSDADADLLALLSKSGLEKVNVGIESGTAVELKLWKKRATVADNVRIMRLLRENGLYLAMGFIQFHPYATADTLQENAEFLRQNCGHNLRRLTERLEIYPGTPLISQLEEDGLLGKRYWLDFDHYDYRYKDEAVERLAKHFASLYNNDDYHVHGVITEQSNVFKFETFNVVVSTFLSRLQRRFGHLEGANAILSELRDGVQDVRNRLAQFNYEFFMENVYDVLHEQVDPRKRVAQTLAVDQVFGEAMREIRTMQLVAGRRLGRGGIDVGEISSVMQPQPVLTRAYTGGGTPCW